MRTECFTGKIIKFEKIEDIAFLKMIISLGSCNIKKKIIYKSQPWGFGRNLIKIELNIQNKFHFYKLRLLTDKQNLVFLNIARAYKNKCKGSMI